MEEPLNAKANSDDNDIYVSSGEGSDSENNAASPAQSSSKSTLDKSDSDQTLDQAPKETNNTTQSSGGKKKNHKDNARQRGSNQKGKRDQGNGASNESKNGSKHGESKDDKRKETGLVPDTGGTYSLWVKKPHVGYTHEEAYRTFVMFGSVAEINFIEQFFFVKYYTRESAFMALKRLKGVLNVQPANVRKPGKETHGSRPPMHGKTVFKDSTPRPTEIYVGNISTSSKQKDLESLMDSTNFISLRFHNKNGKGFAFAMYPNLNAAKKAASHLNGHMFQGRSLMCRLAESGSAAYTGEDVGFSLLGDYGSPQDSNGTEVLVKNLHHETKESHLHTLFSRYGGATYVQTQFVPSKNCVEAIVGLHSDWFAQAAIQELQGQIVDGRMLTISHNDRPPSSSGADPAGYHHGPTSLVHGSNSRHGNIQPSSRPSHGSSYGSSYGSSHGPSHGSSHGPVHGSSSISSLPSHPGHPHPAVTKVQQATDLAHRVDALMNEVLDDCHYCDRIKTLMSELQYALSEVAEEVGH